MKVQGIFFVLVLLLLGGRNLSAQTDPLDPFDVYSGEEAQGVESDDKKSASELIQEAAGLLVEERPLDARSKLLLALKKDPKAYRAHLMLSSYYLVHVGHYRLALQYSKQARALYEEKNGPPPYSGIREQIEHSQILYIIAQVRLNLDNYQGALDALDEYTRFGYYDDWYPGTRAWILMKLGRIPEAIKIAQLGLAALSREDEKGQILNMLGILFSMNRDREGSINVFKAAVAQELSQGTKGQPATPLNNVGEVYREIFDEDKAEKAWLRATSLPDGCEHVLPALNLAILSIEELNLAGAKSAIDNFESCVAQFPLRNGEEHRALVHLARGRIDLYSGKVDSAITHFEGAIQRKQWFGKIGTSEGDLMAAGMMSMAQALTSKANHLLLLPSSGVIEYFKQLEERMDLRLRAWWYMRRARQVLIDDLSQFEDLYVRNTDSLIEYPTLGELSAGIPSKILSSRITSLMEREDRPSSLSYYKAYLAENLIEQGNYEEGAERISEVLASIRPKFDNALKLHVLLLQMRLLAANDPEYVRLANAVFALNRPGLRNSGLRLPVNYFAADSRISDELSKAPFLLDNGTNLQYLIKGEVLDGEYLLQFIPHTGVIGNIRVKSNDLSEAVRQLADQVFTIDLK